MIVQATVFLQNYLRFTGNSLYIPPRFVDCEDNQGNIIPGHWRREVTYNNAGPQQVGQITWNRYTFEARRSRDDFLNFFNSQAGEIHSI